MSKKIRVGILFGGRSAEHEVSLRSAKNVIEAIDKDKYEVVLLGIDKQGRWRLNEQSKYLLDADNPKLVRLNTASDPVALAPSGRGELLYISDNKASTAVDVVFPILHGPFGEDGTVQGLLKLADIPFVGAGVLGSAVGMDKDVMKRLLRDADIPIAKFISFRRPQEIDFDKLKAELGLPLFVKPANMGSSVGVSKVNNNSELSKAVEDAFKYDRKIVIEEFIKGREIECSVLGNEEPMASVPGEVIPSHEFYSYEAKYIDEHGAAFEAPAKLSAGEKDRVQALAIKTFKVLECAGLARVDFFLTANSQVFVNEINTMPGFTSISMYPRLWQASGVAYPALIDRLIQLAIEKFEKEKKIETSYLV